MTIYDIAKEAGVSASTVSRVINNKPGVRKETKKKIQQLLAKYNYSPNEAARGLVTQASKIIGILVDDIRTIHHTDGAYIIERELVKLGYCCIIFNTGTDEASKANYINILKRRRVEGAVLIGSSFQVKAVEQAIKKYLSDTPIVMANGYLDLPNVYGILADEQNGVANCVKLLFDKGYRRPAFVIDLHTPSNLAKKAGFEQAVQSLAPGEEILVYETERTLQGGYKVTQKIVRERPDVDGIIYAVDLLAAAGTRALIDMAISIPEQVAVIGIDNSIYAEICNPKLTSLDNKLLNLSMTAAHNLISALNGKQPNKKILIFSSIEERETT
ncbi:MAG TPA: LacI family DNA-binding transcriptional regulator [Bacillota bacterium]|jgi:LacI family transcriptional regulator|nr:LacI family transcriptional regulator [Bacillota bacterium]HOA34769.1 LacI family DNA-binding transcriptional regulator [Bacillota bacterium]HOJ84589.1 LacI family DNA-binding transcriptional regulator [Bacillota bacterium]HOL15969.1 LacI family DNA-binding transcriptional regulator [Bacillota bacterium]HPZ12199.1 LacI family DNA-binding transcriptional regulator [Bacillota bacterium]